MTRSRPLTELTAGLVLTNEDGRRFKIAAVTTRVAVIVNESGDFVASVSHEVVRALYREILA